MCERKALIIHLTITAACSVRHDPLTYEMLDSQRSGNMLRLLQLNQGYSQAELKDIISALKGLVKSQRD